MGVPFNMSSFPVLCGGVMDAQDDYDSVPQGDAVELLLLILNRARAVWLSMS